MKGRKRGPYNPWFRVRDESEFRALRLEKGLTQVEAAKVMGVSVRRVIRAEAGQYVESRSLLLERLSDFRRPRQR